MTPTIDMVTSPYERGERTPVPVSMVQLRYRPRKRWLPSRFNARTVGDDGRILLWNTYTGAVTAFAARHRDQVLALLSHEGTSEPLGQVGEYMVRRGYLVESDANELDRFRVQYMKQQVRQDVLQFILLTSEDCNFRCVYCYEKFERGTMTPATREGIKRLVEKRAPRLDQLAISWFGGEPLYGWEAIEDLQPFMNETARRHGIHYDQHMTTNAYLLNEERATRLLDWGCRRFQITVDGLPDEHDCKRVGRDGSPTYHVILDNLRGLAARKTDFLVDLRVNFDNRNFPRLGAFMESITEDFGGDRRFKMRFRPVGQWGGDNDDQLDTCGTADRKTVLRQLQAKADEVGLAQESGITESAEPGSNVCYAARPYNFIVGATGKLMKCTIVLYEMEENVVGQLHPDGTLEVNDHQMAHWVAPHFESDTMCKSCYVLPGCQGAACPLSRVQHGTRSCCSVKSHLKHEMRVTLGRSGRHDAPRSAPALAGVAE
ncbi:radical SAM protein [Longimicrobium sp.]|uniref:radical SAM protein n=1 Tax=Longimicrobium sp. TaxID=2029185 RepID=UPI002E32750A|nr:radical SAM protein [Longimicrobium sp.]HEX6037840.1 radical SAM protein [Longimicrobium sp.]